MLIDTHCHIHNLENYPDPDAEVLAAKEAGVERIVVVGCEPNDWTQAIAFAEKYEHVFAICGWHPNYTANYDPIDMPLLVKALKHPKVLALGEIGLDYHWDYAPTSVQHKALRDQLKLAEEMNKPVVFHAREAYSDLLDVLEKLPRRPYLFHCFAGTKEDARRALRLGAFFGCDGPITYKKADELREVFKFIPPHKIVLETDAPYMAPVPHRGKANRSAYIPILNKALAELHDMTQEEMAAQTTQNAIDFFGPAIA
jgi:TatD DNase family protein